MRSFLHASDALIVLVFIVCACAFWPGSDSVPTVAADERTKEDGSSGQEHDFRSGMRFMLLEPTEDLPEGVQVFIQEVDKPRDRFFIVIVSQRHFLSNIKLELKQGAKVLREYGPISATVPPRGCCLSGVRTRHAVITQLGLLPLLQELSPPADPNNRVESVKLGKFSALIK